jgi:hypothetical protein
VLQSVLERTQIVLQSKPERTQLVLQSTLERTQFVLQSTLEITQIFHIRNPTSPPGVAVLTKCVIQRYSKVYSFDTIKRIC